MCEKCKSKVEKMHLKELVQTQYLFELMMLICGAMLSVCGLYCEPGSVQLHRYRIHSLWDADVIYTEVEGMTPLKSPLLGHSHWTDLNKVFKGKVPLFINRQIYLVKLMQV